MIITLDYPEAAGCESITCHIQMSDVLKSPQTTKYGEYKSKIKNSVTVIPTLHYFHYQPFKAFET